MQLKHLLLIFGITMVLANAEPEAWKQCDANAEPRGGDNKRDAEPEAQYEVITFFLIFHYSLSDFPLFEDGGAFGPCGRIKFFYEWSNGKRNRGYGDFQCSCRI
ncbi:hypothetical protein RhiirA4_423602 [Rhizophagus irregularis]|uniref:Uncharacterized protein n=1 Tax=Rhizophagus irregularis TaxID=588596 RepID=A0A2I1GUC4_9GLOM|nr:hypothetical protein RhiirA4_423602 [Rhizophagus irregularis]